MEEPALTRRHKPAWVAGFWLVLAIPAGLAIGYPLSLLREVDLRSWEPGLILGLTHFGAGYFWARSLAQRAGLPFKRRIGLAAGLGYASTFLGGLYLLMALRIDPARVRLPIELPQPDGYLAIFASWMALVAGGTGLALGLGVGNLRTAMKLLGWGLLAGFVVFLIISLSMGLLGFEIGGRHPPRPTMLPVTFLGAWSVALVGSAAFGLVLSHAHEHAGANPPTTRSNSTSH